MDDLYRSFHYSSSCPTTPTIGHIDFVGDGIIHQDQNMITSATAAAVQQYCLVSHDHDHDEDDDNEGGGFIKRSSNDDVIKAQIANHPLYPTLLSSYIDCTKVGAPPEMTSVLEEISEENRPTFVSSTEIGTDPELDHFMKSYCDALHKYKEELSKPFDEATNFLSSIGSQLTDLCKETLPSTNTYSHHHSSTAEWEEGMMMRCGGGEVVEGGLKEMVMRKYSGYVSSLRKEMLKKSKKGKLPKLAISALLDWWNTHYRWPYPTEEEKSRLSEMTGLDLKQINNWFINQRKRYWRPSEDMRSALMEGVAAAAAVDNAAAASAYFPDMTSS